MTIASFNNLAMNVPTPESISAVSSNPNSANDPTSLRNEFITLMVAQIQNQDPLNPLDGTEYVGQLAQFSQVESTENMSKTMQNGLVRLDNMQVLNTANLVGRKVYVESNQMSAEPGRVQEGRFDLPHASNKVVLVLEDQYGNVTKKSLGAHKSGEVNFSLDPDGLGLTKGNYRVSVALDEGQAAVRVSLAGEVTQVRIPPNGASALVKVQGIGSVPFYDINQFGA